MIRLSSLIKKELTMALRGIVRIIGLEKGGIINMDKTYVCDVSEQECKELLGIYEMKNTLESLVMQIAGNNDILKEDSSLYSRLIEDYKKNMADYNSFWAPYLEKYEEMLDQDSQLSMDFRNNKLFIIPKEHNSMG